MPEQGIQKQDLIYFDLSRHIFAHLYKPWKREKVRMVARSRRFVSRSNMHEQCRSVSPIYSTFSRCLGSQQQHNFDAQIPYLEKKSKQND